MLCDRHFRQYARECNLARSRRRNQGDFGRIDHPRPRQTRSQNSDQHSVRAGQTLNRDLQLTGKKCIQSYPDDEREQKQGN